MASANYYFFVVMVLTVPFVENAPSNIVKAQTKEEEIRTRLVFIDRDPDDIINSNSQMTATALSETARNQVPKTSLTRTKHFAGSAQTQNGPSQEVKASSSSSLSNMDDERQIWGIADDSKQLVEDESSYNRPLFLPRTVVKPQDHTKHRVLNKVVKESSIPKPSACDMSIVICCKSHLKLKECFNSAGCSNATEDMFSYLCSSDSINKIIKELGKYYKGNQEK